MNTRPKTHRLAFMDLKPNLEVSFSKGPNIRVHFTTEGEGFRVTLRESNKGFQAFFFTEVDKALCDKLLTWLEAYGRGTSSEVDFLPRQKTPSFTQDVLNALSLVPFGDVVSYGELAHQAGSPRAVRAVGTICRLNQYPLFIPCHRVIRKGGSLGGFAFGSSLKTTLLHFEEEFTL